MKRSTARHPSRPFATAACVLAATLAVGFTSACTHRAGPNVADAGPTTPLGGVANPAGPGGAGATRIPGSAEDFRINIGDRVYFDLDSHQVRSDAYPRLDAQAAWLQRYPGVSVRIEGNADERGTREYNLALGARRAEAVRAHLIGQGVSPARIDTISFGKERPIASGSNEAAFAQNRNAHTALVNQP